MVFTREQLLKPRTTAAHTIDIDGLGMVRIRELTVGEAKELATAFVDKDAEATFYVLQRCMIDENGEPLLRPEEVTAIDSLGIATAKRIVSAILEKSGMSAQGEKPAPKP